MIISANQIRQRLAALNVRVGDVHFDPSYRTVDIFARADNRLPGKYSAFAPDGIEALVKDAADYFHGLEFKESGETVLDDGRKVPA